MNTHEIGVFGEDIAQRYLKKQGYTIAETNFRLSRMAEIDIVARHKGVLVFVEVKLRTGTKHGYGREAVDKRKQENIRLAAQYWLQTNEKKEVPCRFDVLEITVVDGSPQFELIQNAF